MTLEKRKKIEWILDALSLGAVLQYAAYRFLQSTMFVFYYSNTYKMVTMLLLIVFGGIRWLYLFVKKWRERDGQGRNRFLLYCLGAAVTSLPFFYVGWKHDYKVLIFLPVCCMCLYDMNSKMVCRAFSWTIGIALSATILCCLSETVRNLVHTRDGGRSVAAYGIINTTDFASYITFLLLGVWCGIKNTSRLCSLLFALIAGTMSFIAYVLTDSRTAIYIGILIVAFSLWDGVVNNTKNKYIQKIDTGISWLSTVSFPLIGIFTLVLLICYANEIPWALKLDDALSNRLSKTMLPYNNYGIHAFGNVMSNVHGVGGTLLWNAWSSEYGYLDIAYAMLVIKYGWVLAAVFTCIWVWTTIKAAKKQNRRIAVALFILAFHAFSEARILDVNYNIFLIMPFCAMENIGTREEKTEKLTVPKWIPVLASTVCVGAGVYFTLPRMLSWLRTYFAINDWNRGIAAEYSLVICASIIILLVLLWKSLVGIIQKQGCKTVAGFSCVVVLIVLGFLIVNSNIETAVVEQDERLIQEERVIRLVQENATQPVYVAESSELYNRKFGHFSDHLFSTEQLPGSGSIFVDSDVEAPRIILCGGLYSQITKHTGLYTYDIAIVTALAHEGYMWTPYHSGWKSCNLKDTAVFNEIEPRDTLLIIGPKRLITTNMETDQFSGLYEVEFELSSFQGASKEPIILEVVGETDEKEIVREEITNADFDSDGRVERKIRYAIGNTPKVSYAVTVPEGIRLNVDGISWERLFQHMSSGVAIEPDGHIVMTTSVPDNHFNLIHFQLLDIAGNYILSFGDGSCSGMVSGKYVHNLPSGYYYIRIKGNTNLADEWVRNRVFIEEGETIQYSYIIQEIDDDHIIVSNVQFGETEIGSLTF